MYTFDEWGNSVLHIRTGKEGKKMLEEAGFKSTMSDEEYRKHMESHYRLQKEKNDRFLNEWYKLWKSISN